MKKNEMQQSLFETIASARTSEEVEWLLIDLCTPKELENMAQRLAAARLMLEGMTYQEVTQETTVSSATLSRVSRCLQEGRGYRYFLGREEEPEA